MDSSNTNSGRAGSARAWGVIVRWTGLLMACLGLAMLLPLRAQAQETVCARVKIEIKQELTLQRQGTGIAVASSLA